MKQTKETSRNTIKTPVQYLKQGNKNKSALKHLWNTLKTSRIPLESFLNHPNMHTNHPKYGHPLPPRMVKPSPVWESKMWRKVWSPTISRMVTSHPSVTSTHNLQNIHQPSQVWSPTIPRMVTSHPQYSVTHNLQDGNLPSKAYGHPPLPRW